MRKILVFPIIMTAFFAGFDAFCATTRGSRSGAGATNTDNTSVSSGNQPISARVANRTRAQALPTNAATSATAARAATRTSVVRSAKTPVVPTTVTTNTKNTSGVAARAGGKQKAVNMGTKVNAATENTIVPEECRTAFDGCMDSFCMIANTSGGRCRCDDRGEELDSVLDQIMKLDMQSKTLAEEGVERLQRGEAVNEIYAMAEDAANRVIEDQKKNQKKFLEPESDAKSNKLDLSLFDINLFDTDDLFGDLQSDDILESDLSDKKGSALRSAATKMCVSNVPSQCKEHSSMLQLIYAQKIKSDCVAYENDLKQQKMNSETLLQTAQKAVRDAAAEQYESKNKYKTVGECVIAFKQCMIGEDVCGDGFSQCVLDPSLATDSSSNPYTINVSKNITVEISMSTYSVLDGKRGFCDKVLNQCVNVNKDDAVWKQFLLSAAPELKSAEYVAEDNARGNCAKNVLTCIKEKAKVEGFTEGSDTWYQFTSNPNNVKDACPGEFRQCNAYDNEMGNRVMEFVTLALNALRADRCTTKIKECLESDKVCHSDYSNCIGVDGKFLWDSCGEIVKPDCTGTDYNTDDELQTYIAKVAKGVLLNLDNEVAKRCNQAVESKVAALSAEDLGLDDRTVHNTFGYGICTEADPLTLQRSRCDTNIDGLTDKKLAERFVVFRPYAAPLSITIDVTDDVTKSEPFGYIPIPENSTYANDHNYNNNREELASRLNAKFKSVYNRFISDPTISNCLNGVSGVVGFDNEEIITSGTDSKARKFPNLTASAKSVIAESILNAYSEQWGDVYEEYNTKRAQDASKIAAAKHQTESLKECEKFVKSRYNLDEDNTEGTVETGSNLLAKYMNVTVLIDDGQCCADRVFYGCKEMATDGKTCQTWNEKLEYAKVCFYKMN